MLELKNVSGGYGKNIIVSDVSLSFPKGMLTSVIGANGCGKSTLLMLCAGLIPCRGGSVFIDGEDMAKMSRNAVSRRISYLEQMKSPGSISVRSLVAHGRFPYLGYPRKYTLADNEIIDNAMELAGVTELSHRMVNELSGGQQQRVRIAMVLAQDTDIILLDEPLTYLDVRYKLEMTELISRLRDMGKTVIAVMHDPELAFSYSDRVAVMDKGCITLFDTPDKAAVSAELEAALGVRGEYCGHLNRYFFERV